MADIIRRLVKSAWPLEALVVVIDQVPAVVEVGLKLSAIVYVPLVTVFVPALSLTYTLSEKLIEVSVGYLMITVVGIVPKTKINV